VVKISKWFAIIIKQMENNFLNELLIDPLTKEPLIFDEASGTLRSSLSGNKYCFIGSVPQLIIGENQVIAKSTLHLEYDSDFKYINHYQKDADLFDYSEQNMSDVTKNEFARVRESIIKEISNDVSVILDVGCGNGWVSKKLIPLGKKVISMDISSTNPINAVKDVPHRNHSGLIADVYNVPLKENSIDCIIASEILEHVLDPKSFIINLIKLLKLNGKLIITTPYNEKIEYSLCVHCNKPTPKFAHLNSFNEENIVSFFPQKGIIWSSKKFINNYLSRIRSHLILKFLPFNLWQIIDNFFTKLFNKPTRLQIVIIRTI
jgi:2-polyprenyl-3-methyl-5-hydroxy-6-metoxy-1,4-benzoquinol methylase